MSTSLKPGVSMRVIFPVVATLTHDVTAWKFLPLLNSHAILSLAPSNSSANIYAIADKAVDLPWPHSPNTHVVHLSSSSLFLISNFSIIFIPIYFKIFELLRVTFGPVGKLSL